MINTENTSVRARMKQYLNRINISEGYFEVDCGLSKGYVSKIGDSIRTAILNKIINKHPDLNTTWLLTGEGSMLKSDRSNVTPVPSDNYMMVEYADLRASAGRLGGSDILQLPETHTRLVPKEYEKGDFLVVRVDGDSMDDGTKRSLSDGDEVLIKEKQDYKINELPIKKALFVITTREGNVLKQIAEVNTEEEYVLCRSFNPDPRYDDFKIYFNDIYQIFIVCKKTQSQISF
ncbi:helix-turn-helix transcriptional regulator [uncultured Dysgonomonas sp.]|uniref:Peptidase S24/S26A/S26B/S26C domain-containing protein n=1 Tax=uncultured Dysgonomonas sp. TaxID=206096 RepID=A0A212IXL4_9BACT|nr:helix-turn-helix transcriptional regulator [uncultured Dysgonomonas sp.]SBV91685.1 conserved hypothetical protein [uncultured Dysgonomonas sp.]